MVNVLAMNPSQSESVSSAPSEVKGSQAVRPFVSVRLLGSGSLFDMKVIDWKRSVWTDGSIKI